MALFIFFIFIHSQKKSNCIISPPLYIMEHALATDGLATFSWQNWEYAILFTPLILGFGSMFLSGKLTNVGRETPATPAPWVFGLVWTVLYMLLGAAFCFALSYWYYSSWKDTSLYGVFGIDISGQDMMILNSVLYSLLIVCLFAWPILYNRLQNPRIALYELGICIMLTLMCIFSSPTTSKLCLSPLLAWLVFALLLDFRHTNRSINHDPALHKYLRGKEYNNR